MKMYVDEQKVIWDKNWASQRQINPQEILDSRFTKEAYRCLKKFINGKKDNLILEAGCGTGRFCYSLAKDSPNSHISGLDISLNSLKIANRLKERLQVSNVSFVRGNLFQMPFPDNYFDVVFNEGVIEHFSLEGYPTYKDALHEMVRITKKGGKVLVAVPNWYCFPHTIYKWVLTRIGKKYRYGYEKSFKHRELIKLFSEIGLKEIEITGFYPAHGFYRLSGGRFHKIFYYLGRFTDIFNKLFDRLTEGYFTKCFGFEIVIKGVKP